MQPAVLLLVCFACSLTAYCLIHRYQRGALARERVFGADDPAAPVTRSPGWLARWLSLAGFRNASASLVFVLTTLAAVALGGSVLWGLFVLDAFDLMAAGLATVPGGIGDLFYPMVFAGPWLALVVLSLVPWLYVRSVRRRRVEEVEQDLPIALDLLATLSESGLGFDAAIERIFHTRLSERPLAQEFRTFQADLLAGRNRPDSLRRLSSRLDVTSVTILVSALVQAEQIGMGLADVLRRQAEDLRGRRRERANSFAAALPVKLMFPLVACFLPGLFVWTLGLVFLQFFQIADSLIRARGGP